MATPEAITEAVTALYDNDLTTGILGPFAELNQEFVLASGYLVFFMHCGFAMVRQLSPAKCFWARAHAGLLVQPGVNICCACSFPSDV